MFKKTLITLFLISLVSSANAQMAGSYISQLPVGTTPTGTELFPVWQNNATKRLTLNQISLGSLLPVVNGTCIVGVGGFWTAGSCSGISGSGTVTTGVVNQLAYYPASSNSVSGLATINNGILITSGAGAPSIATTVPNGVTATTQTAGDATTKIATTGFVNGTALTLTNGTAATTQSAGDNTTKVATDAFVTAAVGLPFKAIKITKFDTPGTATWERAAGCVYGQVEAQGGGGVGGVHGSSSAWGAAGGSGGYSISYLSLATLGNTQTVTVGAGGTTGANGGDSSFGSLVVAKGAPYASGDTPGAAAATGTGDIALPGYAGSTGGGSITPMNGQNSKFGGAGSAAHASAGAAQAAQGYGSGGGSALSGAAGAGFKGVVIVTEYLVQ